MMYKILPLIALVSFSLVPLVLGNAEDATPKKEVKEGSKDASKETAKEVKEAVVAPKKISTCLASEEIISDLDAREKILKEREEALKEKEKELAAQKTAVDEELTKLNIKRGEFTTGHQKDIAEREEQVNKLIETFESMSPKSAAKVIGGVEDELAVMALTKLTSTKSGKILANLNPEKSAHLSEMMAFGKARKEAVHESDRNPASSSK